MTSGFKFRERAALGYVQMNLPETKNIIQQFDIDKSKVRGLVLESKVKIYDLINGELKIDMFPIILIFGQPTNDLDFFLSKLLKYQFLERPIVSPVYRTFSDY